MKGRARVTYLLIWVILRSASAIQADYLTVYGGPAYDPATGNGFQEGTAVMVNASGTAIGTSIRYDDGSDKGNRAVRWDGTGAVTELGHLGTDGDGVTFVSPGAINDTGTVVGGAYKYVGGNYVGQRAVRWDASGTSATELDGLGTDSSGYAGAWAYAINSAGTAVGWAEKYVDGISEGGRAVRWDASGMVTELGTLGIDSNEYGVGMAAGINDSGIAVGYARRSIDGGNMGYRVVRWDASGESAVVLGDLGTDGSGYAQVSFDAINGAGTAVGSAEKYDSNGVYKGKRAVRWDGSTTAATELGNLGTDGSGSAQSAVDAINDAGVAVGIAYKYVGGSYLGFRAVRWDAFGTDAMELGNLGTDSSGKTYADAAAIDASGEIVGWAEKYDANGNYLGSRAVYWGLDGNAVDLNGLIDPTSGWTLAEAWSISDTSWIAGDGLFDPDGPGGFKAYERLFLVQIPEPASTALLLTGSLVLLRRRRLCVGRW